MKKSFVLYDDSLDVLDELTDEQAGQLLKAMRDFENGKEPTLKGILKAVWIPFKNQLNRDKEKYEKICEVKRMAGLKSGEVRKRKAKRTQRTPVQSVQQNGTPVNCVEHNRTKRTYTDSDNDSDNDNVSDSDSENDNNLPTVKATPKKPNKEINLFFEAVKKETGLPAVAGQASRRFAFNFLRALKKEYPAQNENSLAQKVVQIAVSLNDGWHSTKAHDPKHLFYNWQEIVKKGKETKDKNTITKF